MTNDVSDGAKVTNPSGYLRAVFLCCQLRDGGYHCQECGTYYERPRDLRLARLTPGRWSPANAVLLGSGPDTCGCFERKNV